MAFIFLFLFFKFLNNVAGDMNIKTCKQTYTMGESHCMFNVLTIGTLYISFAHTQGIFTKDFLLVFFARIKAKLLLAEKKTRQGSNHLLHVSF